MARKKQQAHYFEVLNIFIVVVIGVVAYALQDELNATIITLGVLGYFILNVLHAGRTNTLSATRVAEIGALALVAEFILLTYVI